MQNGVAFNGTLRAYDYTTGAWKTGVAGNITPQWVKDGVVGNLANTTVTEISNTLVPGLYSVQMNATDASALVGATAGNCSVANVNVVGTEYGFVNSATILNVSNGTNTVMARGNAAWVTANVTNLDVPVSSAANAANAANVSANSAAVIAATGAADALAANVAATAAAADALDVKRVLKNKCTVTFNAGNTILTIMADDGVTPLYTAPMTNNDGTKFLITDSGPANIGPLA